MIALGTIKYVAASCMLSIFPLFSFAQNYVQTNLVSDIPQPANPSTGPALFFAAGINDYADGLFGTLTPTTPQLNAEDHQ